MSLNRMPSWDMLILAPARHKASRSFFAFFYAVVPTYRHYLNPSAKVCEADVKIRALAFFRLEREKEKKNYTVETCVVGLLPGTCKRA